LGHEKTQSQPFVDNVQERPDIGANLQSISQILSLPSNREGWRNLGNWGNMDEVTNTTLLSSEPPAKLSRQATE
jgi:hypothetical protein